MRILTNMIFFQNQRVPTLRGFWDLKKLRYRKDLQVCAPAAPMLNAFPEEQVYQNFSMTFGPQKSRNLRIHALYYLENQACSSYIVKIKTIQLLLSVCAVGQTLCVVMQGIFMLPQRQVAMRLSSQTMGEKNLKEHSFACKYGHLYWPIFSPFEYEKFLNGSYSE